MANFAFNFLTYTFHSLVCLFVQCPVLIFIELNDTVFKV